MKYSEILEINESFQYSINLQFDINNISKIKEYIPTKDSCEVLEYYIDSILGNFSKSTTLIGPYGKGKSHLLLVLLTLLNNYNEEDKKIINDLLNKIKKINEELYVKLSKIRNDKLKYMPVIINSNYNNMNQAFLLALSEALQRENIDDIVIDTYFSIALKVIEKWEQDEYEDISKKLNKYLRDENTSLSELKSKLKMYDEKAYKIFKSLYSYVMHGLDFNPLINTDIVKYYKDINYRITDYGYNGMLIIFDEFSKFLEYVGNENMMKDLKLIQDFAELASRTGKREQIIFSCITHKTVKEYIKNLKKDKVNAFKTVEGRFKEIYFNRSMEQNYEIISQTIIKKNKFQEYIDKKIEEKNKFYKAVEEVFSFARIDKADELIYKGCYPLNPVTVFCVIHLCEKIAQNERTLFTFLTDDDTSGLKYFIRNSNGNELFNIDKIYDYFYNILKKETDEEIKRLWIKAETSINKLDDEIEQRIIKAISIIYMIDRIEEVVPRDKTLQLALDLDENVFKEKIDNLIEKGIIKKKKTNKAYDFCTVYNKGVQKEIDQIIETKFMNINIKETLSKIINLGYVMPRRYNQKYKMTRFFKMLFISEEELSNIQSFNILKQENFSDGLILNLIKINDNTDELQQRIGKIKDDKVLVRIPEETISEELIATLKEYEAIQYMRNMQNNDEEIIKELELIKEEDIELVQAEIEKKFDNSRIKKIYYLNKAIQNEELSRLTSKICEEIYNATPIINNELVNKNQVTAPIYKARSIVIDAIINNDSSIIKNNTSAEATIYKAIWNKKDNEDIRNVLNLVKEFMRGIEGKEKVALEELYKKLQNKPYGIRNGVLPVLLSIAIEEYGENIVLYYKNKEIEMNSQNISKSVEEADKYYIYVEKGTHKKITFVSNLLNIFSLEESTNYRNNIKILINEMKRWVLSLPKITREQAKINSIVYKEAFIKTKNELLKPDINNNEFLFQELSKIFETKNYDNLIEELGMFKKIYDNYLEDYINLVTRDFKELFEHNSKSSLNIILNNWNKAIDSKVKETVVRIEIKKLFEYTNNLQTHNEKEIIENISNILLGKYIEDWQEDTKEEFFDKLNSILDEINKMKNLDLGDKEKIFISVGDNKIQKYIDNTEITLLGNTLKNNIEDSLEEYGDSVSESEKIKILLQIIKKYM